MGYVVPLLRRSNMYTVLYLCLFFSFSLIPLLGTESYTVITYPAAGQTESRLKSFANVNGENKWETFFCDAEAICREDRRAISIKSCASTADNIQWPSPDTHSTLNLFSKYTTEITHTQHSIYFLNIPLKNSPSVTVT